MLFTMRKMYVDRDPKMAQHVQNINHSAFMSMFERETIQPLPAASTTDSATNVLAEWNALYDADNEKQAGMERFDLIQTFHACKQEEGKSVAAYVLQIKGYVDQLERFVRNYNIDNLGKTIGELHAMLIEYEKGLPKKAKTTQVIMIKGGKIQKSNKKSLKAKGKGKANGKGKDKQVYIPKTAAKEHPDKDNTCRHCKEVGLWKRNCLVYLAELLKKKQVGIASSSGFREARKLKQGSLYLYVGNGVRAQVEAIGSFDLVLPNGLVICLDNCHNAPSITRESATRILNMVPTKKVDKAPYELWYGKVPNLSYLKETMGYYFYFPLENKIVVARYAEFFEGNLISQEVSGKVIDLEEIQVEDTSPSKITCKIPMEVEGFEPPQEEVILIRKSKRTHRAPNRLCLNVEVKEHSLGDLNEPTSYKAEMLDSESNKWIDAMNAEIQSIMDNMVWVLVYLPPGYKTVGSKWIYKKKTDIDGIVHTYKARLVAKGYTQLYGVDYEETFSPVDDIRAIRILISIVAYYDYEIWKIDVKTAFLNGYLDEDIYMVQPEGFVDSNHPRKASEINVTFLILYVDDIIIMGNHIPSLQRVKDYLEKCFAMKDLGEATFILGIKIYIDRSKRLFRLGQNAYMEKILKRYKMDNSKRGHIPMQERVDLNKTQGASTPKEVKRMQNVPYASAVAPLYGPRKTFKMLALTVFQGAKRYFLLDDPLRLKKYFSDDHLRVFTAAQCFTLELVGQSRLVSIEGFKQYAKTIIAIVKAYKDTSQFRAALVKKVNNWFQKEEEEPKKKEEEPNPIGATWKVSLSLERFLYFYLNGLKELRLKLVAMNAKMQSMYGNKVWRLIVLPPNAKVVKSKWIYKKKMDIDGKSYWDSHNLIAIATYYDYEIWQMDVKTMFLNGFLEEEIYMEQPEGFIDPIHLRKVCKLQRSVYGLKPASRSWNKRFDEEIKKFGFHQNLDEPCVYKKASGINVIFLILYVDDIILIGNHIPSLQETYLGKCFFMKDLEEMAFILGIKIYRDRSRRLIGLSQNAYLDKILKRYRMDNSKRGSIPIQVDLHLSKSQCATTSAKMKRMQNVPYASAVGAICILGDPEAELRVNSYCDAGFKTDRDDTKSQTGCVIVLNGGTVVWKSSKQSTTAQHATEAEYIAASKAAKEDVWVRKYIDKLGVVPSNDYPIKMNCDNSATMIMDKESGIQKGARHFKRKYHYVRECIKTGKIDIVKVHTYDNLADPFTKALAGPKLTRHSRSMGLRPASSFM
uniref:Reverse transcriptase Ty1/copia-type domain-containing protein n=1 Tax=Tanacetum cinerariifolium TaxID=118510 RepID=A0A6L2L9Z0_TANCI|nr:hypothetical protein [Tanacetum cinerariifolium]